MPEITGKHERGNKAESNYRVLAEQYTSLKNDHRAEFVARSIPKLKIADILAYLGDESRVFQDLNLEYKACFGAEGINKLYRAIRINCSRRGLDFKAFNSEYESEKTLARMRAMRRMRQGKEVLILSNELGRIRALFLLFAVKDRNGISELRDILENKWKDMIFEMYYDAGKAANIPDGLKFWLGPKRLGRRYSKDEEALRKIRRVLKSFNARLDQSHDNHLVHSQMIERAAKVKMEELESSENKSLKPIEDDIMRIIKSGKAEKVLDDLIDTKRLEVLISGKDPE